MEKVKCTMEICEFYARHYKMREIRVTHPDELYSGTYEGYLMEDGCALLPFGSWIEVYPPTEFELANKRKETP